MARYLPPANNVTFTDLIVTANSYSDNWIGLGLVMITFFIIFIATGGFNPRSENVANSFAAASFITFIVAIFLRIINIINGFTLWATIILTIGAFTVLFVSKRTV